MGNATHREMIRTLAQNLLADVDRQEIKVDVMIKQIRGVVDLIEADVASPPKVQRTLKLGDDKAVLKVPVV